MLHAASSSNLALNIEQVAKHACDYHASSSDAFNVHAECSNVESTSGIDKTDWYIAGGSSGGSAVAVATGVAFA